MLESPWIRVITPSPARCDSRQWANVLVHVEEVARVVLLLELLQPAVVGPVGGGGRVARLIVAEVIHIPSGGDEGLHRRICFPSPRDAPIGVCRRHPFGEHDKVVTGRAVREGRVTNPYPGYSAVEVLQEQLAHWGGAASE